MKSNGLTSERFIVHSPSRYYVSEKYTISGPRFLDGCLLLPLGHSSPPLAIGD